MQKTRDLDIFYSYLVCDDLKKRKIGGKEKGPGIPMSIPNPQTILRLIYLFIN